MIEIHTQTELQDQVTQKRPTTTDGSEDKISIQVLTKFVTGPFLAYSARKIPAPIDKGTEIIKVITRRKKEL